MSQVPQKDIDAMVKFGVYICNRVNARLGYKKIISIPDWFPIILCNGEVKCDMLIGPCSCGAWHNTTNDTRQIYV